MLTKECGRGMKGAAGIGWVYILLVSPEALPTTEDRHTPVGKVCSWPLSSLTCAWVLAEIFFCKHLIDR